GARERAPIETIVIGAVAGGKNDRPVDASQRRGDGGRGQSREPRRDARDDPERHARGLARQRLLAATPEHARTAALEPQHALSLPREFDEAVRDVALLGGRTAAALARNSSRAWGPASASTRRSTSAS